MNSKSYSFLLVLCLNILPQFGEMSFCDKFKQNSFKIDFGYQMIKQNNSFESFVSIENIFWRIKFEDQRGMSSEDSLTLIDKDIDVSLQSRYQMAFCIPIGDKCITGLKNSKTIDWVLFEDSNEEIHQKVYANSIKYDFKGFDPSVAFVHKTDPIDERNVFFLQQFYDIQKLKFRRELRNYYIDSKFEEFYETIDLSNDNTTNVTSNVVTEKIEGIEGDDNILAVFNQIRANEEERLVLLILTERQIKYCFVSLSQTEDKKNECNINRMPTLIYCPQNDDSEVTDEDPEDDHKEEVAELEGMSANMKILIIFLVLTVILIIGLSLVVIVILLMSTKRKGGQTSSSLSESSRSDKNEEKEKSVVQTIYKKEGWDTELNKKSDSQSKSSRNPKDTKQSKTPKTKALKTTKK